MNETLPRHGMRAAERCFGPDCRLPHFLFGREPLFGFIPSYMVWNVVIILLVALIFWWLLRGSRQVETPLDVLKKRYVSGEIPKDEFEQMKKDIE